MAWNDSRRPSFEWIDTYFFDQYLLDPFCNMIMRLMLIEQLHNKDIQQKYNRWLFEEPYKIEMSVFETLSGLGIMNGETALQAGKNFYGYIAMLVFKDLLKSGNRKQSARHLCSSIPSAADEYGICIRTYDSEGV